MGLDTFALTTDIFLSAFSVMFEQNTLVVVFEIMEKLSVVLHHLPMTMILYHTS